MAVSILNFQEKYTEINAINSYGYNEYQPTSGSNLNISGNITIHIENQDEFFHPRRSYLLVEGNLLKEDGTRYGAADAVALANNGVMHLFSNVKYELTGQEIESVNNPGIAGVLMGIANFPYDYANSAGMVQCFYIGNPKKICKHKKIQKNLKKWPMPTQNMAKKKQRKTPKYTKIKIQSSLQPSTVLHHRHLLQTTSYNHLLLLHHLLISRKEKTKQQQARNSPGG